MTQSETEFAIEIKSGQTLNQSFITPIQEWLTLTQTSAHHAKIIYAGSSDTTIGPISVISWKNIPAIFPNFKKLIM